VSTSYQITKELTAHESSTRITLSLETGSAFLDSYEELDALALRKAIVKLVHVLSYISDDPEEALSRFNVDYGDKE
jgi:hypothetical protein